MNAAVTSRVLRRKLGRAAPDGDACGDRVQVDDAIEAVVRLLQLHEIDDRAEVIAEMQIAGRLDARKNPFNVIAWSMLRGAARVEPSPGPFAIAARRLATRALCAQVVRRRGPNRVKRLLPAGYAENGEQQAIDRASPPAIRNSRASVAACAWRVALTPAWRNAPPATTSRPSRTPPATMRGSRRRACGIDGKSEVAAPCRISDSALLQAPSAMAGGDTAGAEQLAEHEAEHDRDDRFPSAWPSSGVMVSLTRKERRRQRLDQHMGGQAEREPHQRLRGCLGVGRGEQRRARTASARSARSARSAPASPAAPVRPRVPARATRHAISAA